MDSARCFLQRQPWVSPPRREGAADVPTGSDDAPFLLKVRWLREAFFHDTGGHAHVRMSVIAARVEPS